MTEQGTRTAGSTRKDSIRLQIERAAAEGGWEVTNTGLRVVGFKRGRARVRVTFTTSGDVLAATASGQEITGKSKHWKVVAELRREVKP